MIIKLSKRAEQVIPTKEELISNRKILKGLSEEFYLFGTLTKYDFDKIEYVLNFAERCKKDGILTYNRECQELKEKLNQLIKSGNIHDDGFSWKGKIQNILENIKVDNK